MRIDVRSHSLRISPALRQLLQRRCVAAIRGLEDGVESLLVNIEPELADDGTIQRRCRISASTRFGKLDATEGGPDVYSAVQAALGRLSRALARNAARRAA